MINAWKFFCSYCKMFKKLPMLITVSAAHPQKHRFRYLYLFPAFPAIIISKTSGFIITGTVVFNKLRRLIDTHAERKGMINTLQDKYASSLPQRWATYNFSETSCYKNIITDVRDLCLSDFLLFRLFIIRIDYFFAAAVCKINIFNDATGVHFNFIAQLSERFESYCFEISSAIFRVVKWGDYMRRKKCFSAALNTCCSRENVNKKTKEERPIRRFFSKRFSNKKRKLFVHV